MNVQQLPVFRTDRYTSAEFLAREREHIFRRTWLAVARESDLAHPGDRRAVDELDEALMLVRGRDGVVRTFHNACRHRGTRLLSKPCGGARITCPYHGWTYDLDGRLLGVPKRNGFQALDVGSRSLIEVRTECWGGFVWITFDPTLPPVASYLGAVGEQLAPYRLEEMRPLMRRSWTLPCNWKAVLDQATESYHLRPVHGGSIGRVIDTVSTFYPLGLHHLQTIPIADFGWRTWLDRQSVPRDLACSDEQMRLFHKYVLFPNTLINVMPYHLTVFRVFPLTADTCRFHYEFHLRAGAGAIARLRAVLTLLASLYILREDFGVLLPFQAGARAARDATIPFHAEEQPLAYFHATVDRLLQTAAAP